MLSSKNEKRVVEMTKSVRGIHPNAAIENWLTSNRSRTKWLLEGRHLDAQLVAIKELLDSHRFAKKRLTKTLKEISDVISADDGSWPEYAEHMIDYGSEMYFGSFFMDAALSMSAVGMLVPFLEWLFHSIFAGIKESVGKDAVDDCPRAKLTEDCYWNPKIFAQNSGYKTDIVKGIVQLAKSIKLHCYLPGEYEKMLLALYCYRNLMFHEGFVWPPKKREKFLKWNNDGRWPEKRFNYATNKNEPRLFCMSEEFINHCVKMIELILDGVEKYLKDHCPRAK